MIKSGVYVLSCHRTAGLDRIVLKSTSVMDRAEEIVTAQINTAPGREREFLAGIQRKLSMPQWCFLHTLLCSTLLMESLPAISRVVLLCDISCYSSSDGHLLPVVNTELRINNLRQKSVLHINSGVMRSNTSTPPPAAGRSGWRRVLFFVAGIWTG